MRRGCDVVREGVQRARERCVITGMGVVSPIGVGYEEFVASLQQARCGVTKLSRLDVQDLEYQNGGEVAGGLPELRGPAGEPYGRFTQLALVAAQQALADSGVDFGRVEAGRSLLLFATTLGPSDAVESLNHARMKGEQLSLSKMREQWVSTALQDLVRESGFRGEAHTLSQGCSAANYAITYACEGIRGGQYDVALVGGVDTLSRVCLVAYNRFGILAPLCQPFDVNRQGMVCAEGAGMLVLESERHALGRRAPIYAEVLGGATTADAYQMLSPHPDGEALYRSMAEALERAGLVPADVDYISACASGTPLGDKVEAKAIKRLFEPTGRVPPVSASKAQTGHSHGASSALEAIACVAAIRHSFLPSTILLTEPDEECSFDLVANATRSQAVEVALSNASAFGGADSSVVIRKYGREA